MVTIPDVYSNIVNNHHHYFQKMEPVAHRAKNDYLISVVKPKLLLIRLLQQLSINVYLKFINHMALSGPPESEYPTRGEFLAKK